MGAVCCGEPVDFDGEVDLRHFELLRSVGKGAFGKVRIVQKKNDKKVYALKYINKDKCIRMKAVNNVIQERRLLEEIDFPLIVNLRYAFQDDENLFMVLDLMLGGDIRFHLDRNGPMKEEVVRFFIAETGLAIHYLHQKKIVHRDLKPDNILLDENGHAHLTDFNIAVRYSEKHPLKSVAGSLAYMAPEVLAKTGYFASPDWWSLGAVMFELLFGKRPFRGKTNDALTASILYDTLQIPSGAEFNISPECISFLKGLLERDIEKRLGCGDENWELFKAHPFFTKNNSINWDDMANKRCTAPFIPDNKRANFDASHELEELLLEENPLRVKKRSGKRDYSKFPGGENGEYARELQTMEKKFTHFNFERRGTLSNAPTKAPTVGSVTAVNQSNQEIDEGEISMLDLGNVDKEDGKETLSSPSSHQDPGSSSKIGLKEAPKEFAEL